MVFSFREKNKKKFVKEKEKEEEKKWLRVFNLKLDEQGCTDYINSES